MRRIPIVLSLLAAFSVAPGVSAQSASTQSVEQELRTMVAGETTNDRQRANLDSFLERDDVHAVAVERGVDLDRVKTAVNTLDDAEVASLTSRIKEAVGDDDLVGGDTFVVTSSTIIIVLLIIVLIAVI